MTFDVHPMVNVDVVSPDATLLDSLKGELPVEGDAAVGPECEGPTQTVDSPDLDIGEERLTARVSYAVGEDTAAASLYDALTGYNLSTATYEIRRYESPVGAVTAEAVRAYYEENPSEKPTDAHGEAFVPSAWDPAHHTVEEASG